MGAQFKPSIKPTTSGTAPWRAANRLAPQISIVGKQRSDEVALAMGGSLGYHRPPLVTRVQAQLARFEESQHAANKALQASAELTAQQCANSWNYLRQSFANARSYELGPLMQAVGPNALPLLNQLPDRVWHKCLASHYHRPMMDVALNYLLESERAPFINRSRPDLRGNSLMHLAVLHSDAQKVMLHKLVAAGGDLDQANVAGITPRQFLSTNFAIIDLT